MTFCPGKKQRHSKFGSWWDRDLDVDLEAIRSWGAVGLVTLMEDHELIDLRVPNLGANCKASGLDWFHMPIVDGAAPDPRFLHAWPTVSSTLANQLSSGASVVIHCKGGLGRTGTLAALLLQEAGMDPREAMALVRSSRPGAIETVEQEEFLAARSKRP